MDEGDKRVKQNARKRKKQNRKREKQGEVRNILSKKSRKGVITSR